MNYKNKLIIYCLILLTLILAINTVNSADVIGYKTWNDPCDGPQNETLSSSLFTTGYQDGTVITQHKTNYVNLDKNVTTGPVNGTLTLKVNGKTLIVPKSNKEVQIVYDKPFSSSAYNTTKTYTTYSSKLPGYYTIILQGISNGQIILYNYTIKNGYCLLLTSPTETVYGMAKTVLLSDGDIYNKYGVESYALYGKIKGLNFDSQDPVTGLLRKGDNLYNWSWDFRTSPYRADFTYQYHSTYYPLLDLYGNDNGLYQYVKGKFVLLYQSAPPEMYVYSNIYLVNGSKYIISDEGKFKQHVPYVPPIVNNNGGSNLAPYDSNYWDNYWSNYDNKKSIDNKKPLVNTKKTIILKKSYLDISKVNRGDISVWLSDNYGFIGKKWVKVYINKKYIGKFRTTKYGEVIVKYKKFSKYLKRNQKKVTIKVVFNGDKTYKKRTKTVKIKI